jgi:hypothetical protein
MGCFIVNSNFGTLLATAFPTLMGAITTEKNARCIGELISSHSLVPDSQRAFFWDTNAAPVVKYHVFPRLSGQLPDQHFLDSVSQ